MMKQFIVLFMAVTMTCLLLCVSFAEESDFTVDLVEDDASIWLAEQEELDYGLTVSKELETKDTEEQESKIDKNASSGSIKINRKNYPDTKFRAYVSDYFDKNKDGILSVSECKRVESIDVDDAGVYSLVGIEHFPNLERLYCKNNHILSLDVSQNVKLRMLSCSNNRLKKLDVSKNVKLESLYCCHNLLKTLKLGKNKSLDSLHCYDNSDLKSINVVGCGEMKKWVECLLDKYKDNEDGRTYYGWYGKEAGLIIDRSTWVFNGKKLLYKPGNPKFVAFVKKRITIDAGEEVRLSLTMKPAGVASYCTFISSDPSILNVYDHYNYVYGSKEGTATVTVKTANGRTAKIKVTVKGNAEGAW